MADRVTLAYCVDAAYIWPMSASILSIRRNASVALDVHVLLMDVDSDIEEGVSSELSKLLRHDDSVYLHRVSHNEFAAFPIDDRLSHATYGRFLLPTLLPMEDTRCVYLDADTIVNGDLWGLWSVRLHGAAAAAVTDPYCGTLRSIHNWREKGVREPDLPYFNAGVMVLDLEVWRRRGVVSRLLQVVADWGAGLKGHDQEALNIALQGDWLELDEAWNMLSTLEGLRPSEVRSCHVRHFTTWRKPWLFSCSEREAEYYFDEALGPLRRLLG